MPCNDIDVDPNMSSSPTQSSQTGKWEINRKVRRMEHSPPLNSRGNQNAGGKAGDQGAERFSPSKSSLVVIIMLTLQILSSKRFAHYGVCQKDIFGSGSTLIVHRHRATGQSSAISEHRVLFSRPENRIGKYYPHFGRKMGRG